MSDSKMKKGLSLLLAILMVFTMMPATIFSLGADESAPVMKAFTILTGDFHAYRNKIVTVTFLDEIDTAGALYSWDVSEKGNGSVIAWMKENTVATATAGETRYDVFIGGNGGVAANPNSNDLFFGFEVLEEINGLEHFDTSNVVMFKYTFQQCYALKHLDLSSFDTSNVQSFLWMFVDCQSLETLDLSGWDTSSALNMDSMFKNCLSLETLDISSFDTHKVTNMSNMFYRCEKLTTLYTGDNWSVEQVTNSNAMFNCCYAISGKKSYDDPTVSLPHDKKYATTEYFITYKAPEAPETYKVTYSFTGDTIPENVTLPADAVYEEGTTVFVESAPSADGYIFKGWKTEDADITTGSFEIKNDVHIVGSWEKLYKVYYKYDEKFEVPEGAPAPEMLEMLGSTQKAGDDVDVAGVMQFDDRHIFIGWYTADADIAGNMFTMPSKDVTLYGYFKIPVASVEIFNNEDIILNGGEKSKVNVYVKPEDATIKDIIYESSNPAVATVDKYGNITAVEGAEGTTTITVKSADDPSKSDTIEVTVKRPVTELIVSPTDITIREDGSEKIKVTVNEEATNKEVTYTSNDETVVTVDENGIITPVGPGTTTITVASKDDPSIKKTVTVTVKNPVTEITAKDLELTVGDVKNVEAKVNEDATNKELIYDISDPGVAKVDSNGDVIAVGEGTTTVTITSKDDPNIKTTVTVTVKAKMYNVTYAYIGEVHPENEPDAPDKSSHKSGSTVDVEEAPFVEGYTFSGWSTTDAEVTDGSFAINNDVHFIGSWTKINYYNVTYKYEGDVPENAPKYGTKTYEEGTTVTVESTPSAEGYIFSGWSSNDIDVNEETFIINKDVEITGKWTKLYNVTYEYIGEVPTNAPAVPDKESYKSGVGVDVKAAPTLEGYTFSGWSTEDASVVGDKFTMPAKDVVIKGSWTKINYYNVTYKYEGDVPENAPEYGTKTYEEGTKVTVESTPSAEGYIFSGWSSNDIDVNAETFIINKDVEITGKWTKLYNVTYEYIGEVPTNAPAVPDKESYKSGVGVDVKVAPTLEGYTFSGWSTEDASVVDDKFTMPAKDVVIKGSWTKINYYNVTYKYEGDVPEDAPEVPVKVTYEEGKEVIVADKPSSVDGYTFTGWYTNDVTVTDGKFNIYNNVEFIGTWSKIPVEDIVVDKNEFELTEGDTDKITVTVNPENAYDKTVTYTSSDEKVVKVDENGKITAIGEGTATITVTSNDDPSIKEVITVTVNKPVVNYTVTYTYKGFVPEGVPKAPEAKTYESGTEVTVEKYPESIPGSAVFLGWKKAGVQVEENSKFVINSDVEFVGEWYVFVTDITAPEKIEIVLGQETNIGAYVTPGAVNQKLHYRSDDESVVKVDAEGNIVTNKAGTANIYITADANADIYAVVVVTVIDRPEGNGKHYMVFGKTEKIGWYTVSFDGGKTFRTVFGNSNHVVDHGAEVIVRANDVFGDPFTFYINGRAVTPDENGYVRVKVDGYVLVGALGIPVIAPDGYEGLNWIQRIIQAIRDFFAKIANWFKK